MRQFILDGLIVGFCFFLFSVGHSQEITTFNLNSGQIHVYEQKNNEIIEVL